VGVDIYHCKATLTKPKDLNPHNLNYIIEDDFNYSCFDVSCEYFEKYIQTIDVPTTQKKLVFVRNEFEMDEIKTFLKKSDCDFYYEPNLLNIDNIANQYLIKNKMTNSLLHKYENYKWITIGVFDMERKTGFYYEEVGHQIRGMNDRFFEYFDTDSIYCYTREEDFKFALSCVDFCWHDDSEEDVERRKQLFKENFLDKYGYKQSWMHIMG